jgi:hypothetical protein
VIFEQDAKFSSEGAIHTAYQALRASLDSHIDEYAHCHQIGKIYPPKVIPTGDLSVLVECERGEDSHDPYQRIIITISASPRKNTIEASVERWKRSIAGTRTTEKIQAFKFRPDGADKLIEGDHVFSPLEAAQMLVNDLRPSRP